MQVAEIEISFSLHSGSSRPPKIPIKSYAILINPRIQRVRSICRELSTTEKASERAAKIRLCGGKDKIHWGINHLISYQLILDRNDPYLQTFISMKSSNLFIALGRKLASTLRSSRPICIVGESIQTCSSINVGRIVVYFGVPMTLLLSSKSKLGRNKTAIKS